MIEGTNIGVAVACNGKAAKSSDEWGRIAALRVTNQELPSYIPADLLKPSFA